MSKSNLVRKDTIITDRADRVRRAARDKVVYVGKDGISLKQAVKLAELGFRIIIK